MKIQGIKTENGDFHNPMDKGIAIGRTDLKEPKNTDIPAGLSEQMQLRQNGGLAEFQAIKDNGQMDMGSITSRDLGSMLSGELVRVGEAAVKAQNPNADFGDLPSRALTEMGKDVIKSE